MTTVDDSASARAQFLASRPISEDKLVPEDPALGLVAFSSPFDPEPSLRIEDGRIVELDGVPEAEFDLLDEFIARRAIDLEVAEEAMALPIVEFARMVVDPGVPRAEVTRLTAGMTPAKIAATLALLTPGRDPSGHPEDAGSQNALDPGARNQPRGSSASDGRRFRRRGRARVPGARDDGPGPAPRSVQRTGPTDR